VSAGRRARTALPLRFALHGGGSRDQGTVFDLVPNSGGEWTENVLYRFRNGPDGAGPYAGVILGMAGYLYGTTEQGGGYAQGAVYEVEQSKKGWKNIPLYNFTGGGDGKLPMGNLTFDNTGNLYGTTYLGGAHNMGVVFELEP